MRASLKDRVLGTSAALAASGLVAAALAASGGAAVAHAAKTCSIGSGRQFGYTYVTSLTASGASCSTATKLVKAHGRKAGWSCSVKRLATSPIQYQARETCVSGSRKVVWGFSQNT
jgi:hypothetical protein